MDERSKKIAVERIVRATRAYLVIVASKGVPFPAGYTYWWASDMNGDWPYYRVEVEILAGRREEVRAFEWSELREGLACELYETDKEEAILRLYKTLNKHLIVGHMLSAVMDEMEHGPGGMRKYTHPTFAAWRTLSDLTSDWEYCSFKELKLVEDPVIQSLKIYLQEIMERQTALMSDSGCGWKDDTSGSDRYIARKLPEMKERLKAAFDQVTEEIRQELLLLSS
ncbi:MAG: hypothetical protein ABII13_01215 [Patescibacteria group bacterium]